jgi:hypothetical protein
VIASTGTRIVAALPIECGCRGSCGSSTQVERGRSGEGCGIRRGKAVNGGDIDGDRCEDRCVLGWIPASASALLVTLGTLQSLISWFVKGRCVREQVFGSEASVYLRSLLVRLPVGLCSWHGRTPHVPVYPGSPAETGEPQANPKRAPRRDCVERRCADIGRRELCCGRGLERGKDGGCGPGATAEFLRRAIGVSARAGEGLRGDGKRDNRWWRWRGHQVAALRSATAALLERGLSVNVRDIRRMQVGGMR